MSKTLKLNSLQAVVPIVMVAMYVVYIIYGFKKTGMKFLSMQLILK
jgi:hypothetical protein